MSEMKRTRIYLGRLLRATSYLAAYDDKPAAFRFQLIREHRMLKVYDAPTIDDLLKQLRADGHQVWGSDPLDYAGPPSNAFEYMLMESYLKQTGATDDNIKKWFSLDIDVEATDSE